MANLADVIVDADEVIVNPEADVVDDKSVESQANVWEPPAKYKGKSLKDVIEMHQNAESRIGTMANELGIQRQLTDRFLELKRENDLTKNGGGKQKPTQVPVTTNDILDRPQETLERVVDSRVQSVADEVREENRQLRAMVAKSEFVSKHRDYQTTVQSPEFLEWIKASPLRMRAAAAANAGDWVVADDLFTEYEHQSSRQQTTTQTTQTGNLDEARRASFTSSGNSAATDGKAKKTPMFKRSELMKMRVEDPEGYYDEDFQAKVLLAYHEGRVV